MPAGLAITGIPNARVLADVQAWRLVCDEAGPATAGQLRQQINSPATAGIDPEAFWELGDELGYDVDLGWTGSGEQGTFDATFRRRNLKHVDRVLDCTCTTRQVPLPVRSR